MKNYAFTTFYSKLLFVCLLLFGLSCQNKSQNNTTAIEAASPVIETETKTETKTETSSLPDPPSEAIAATLERFSFTDCAPLMEEDSGCSCGFRPKKDSYVSSLFVSNIEEIACVKINGSIVPLTGKRIDDRLAYSERSYQEHWITLKEDGTFLIFGERASINTYYENRALLVQTLLVMDKMPEEIPMQFVGTTGMGMRAELRDMAAEALDMASKAKAEGNTGIPMQMLYQNDQYDILITGYVDGKNDSGGDTYAGTIELKSKNGSVLDNKKFWGDCNC